MEVKRGTGKSDIYSHSIVRPAKGLAQSMLRNHTPPKCIHGAVRQPVDGIIETPNQGHVASNASDLCGWMCGCVGVWDGQFSQGDAGGPVGGIRR